MFIYCKLLQENKKHFVFKN